MMSLVVWSSRCVPIQLWPSSKHMVYDDVVFRGLKASPSRLLTIINWGGLLRTLSCIIAGSPWRSKAFNPHFKSLLNLKLVNFG